MLAWMAYATLVGALLAVAGALLETVSPWLAGRRRAVWVTVITGSIMLAMVVIVAPQSAADQSRAAPPTLSRLDLKASATPGASAPLPNATANSTDVEGPSSKVDATLAPTFILSSFKLDIVLAVFWIALSTLCVAVLAVSAWRVARMRRAWRESVIAGVPVLVSHDVGPAVIGLVHHGIVVPAWVEGLREDEQRTVMTHEREHVRAGDPLLLWGATLLVALLPWNAALWYALRRLRHAIEMDCDARVLRARPDARAYCTLLLDVGERTLAGVAPVAALAEPATLLERRIDAMTAPARTWGWQVGASAAAALLLVVAACRAPRPDVAPQARIAALVIELDALLASDSASRGLSVGERTQAARTLALARAAELRTAGGDSSASAAARLMSSAAAGVTGSARNDSIWLKLAREGMLHPNSTDPNAWEALLTPRVDDALKQYYPQLYSRSDTAALMVVLTYDAAGKLKGHRLRANPHWPQYGAPDFSNVQIERFGMRDLPGLHARLVLVLERWSIDSEPPNSAYGGRNASAESDNVPPAKQFTHRVDSIAHADFPDAFMNRGDAIVVAVLFEPDGRVVRTGRKAFPLGEAFDVVPGAPDAPMAMRNSSYLLSKMFGSSIPRLASSGSQNMREAPHVIFVYGEVARP
jgi:beta-lactamase regulating signal transducer with metallopeptidase domain